MTSKLIVALDFDNQNDALRIIDQLEPDSCALKVGLELFTRFGAEFVTLLVDKGFKVFLDLKFHDIPNQVAQACKAAADLGVWMLNVHASGGVAMMQAAKKSLETFGADKPLLIAVTVLTSFSEEELAVIGVERSLMNQVTYLAQLTKESGLDGVVCSAQEVQAIKTICGSQFIAVTPGIRPSNSQKQDQVRTMTPREAIQAGSDFLVIGRPITQAPDPSVVLQEIERDFN